MCFINSLDYKHIFDGLALGRELLQKTPLPTLALMADAAAAIGNGFELSKISSGIRGTCWFHCKKSFDKGISSVLNKEQKI